jgi:NhaA family Na+:H+ antiporter
MTSGEDGRPSAELARLPKGLVDRFTHPFGRFLRIEAAGGAVLLFVTLCTVAVSNSPLGPAFLGLWELPVRLEIGSFGFSHTVRSVINEGLMTLFFFLLALELKRELVLGELRNPLFAALPIAGALGGMIVPGGVYLALLHGRPGSSAWGMVMATDTAFVIGALALLGSRIPLSLRLFMVSLAIVDDIGSILVVALGYSDPIRWGPLALGLVGVAVVVAMKRSGIRGFPGYTLLGGLVWLAADASGIQPTVTGMVLGLLTPARRWVDDDRLYAILGRVVAHPSGDHGSADTEDRQTLQMAEVAARESLSPVERLEIALHPWVGYVVLPLFALANAGFVLSSGAVRSPLFATVFLGFVVGKPLGILGFGWLAVRFGIARRPHDLGWRLLLGGGLLAGMGFTVPLFIADLALGGELIATAKLATFSAAAVSAVAGLGVLVWASAGPRHAGGPGPVGGGDPIRSVGASDGHGTGPGVRHPD